MACHFFCAQAVFATGAANTSSFSVAPTLVELVYRGEKTMRRVCNGFAVTLCAAGILAAAAGHALAYSQKVEDACAGDYQNFCAQYLPDSTELRRCFESNRKGLSKTCVNALVDAGEVPQKYLKK